MRQGHALAREQIRELVDASGGQIELGEVATSKDGTYLLLEVSLPFQPIERVRDGLPVRARERFLLLVHQDFPFRHPTVRVPHRRWAGFAHVQWTNQPCLYQAPSIDWDPADGLFGLVTRLDSWVRDAAMNRLDPEAAPLHPPVAYRGSSRLVVPKADTPITGNKRWIGLAVLEERAKRTEIVDWVEIGSQLPDNFAAALLLAKLLPFEFPTKVNDLTRQLEQHGLPYGDLVRLLALLALRTPAGSPFLVIVGAPMRRAEPGGPLLPHLEAWEIDADAADELRKLNAFFMKLPGLETIGEDAKDRIVKWSLTARVRWCDVRELRPSVTRRRDIGSAARWFHGRNIELWGCGAIGSHVAESIVRAGAKRLVLRDSGRVMPGLLVRQAFDDEDIGEAKATALGARLKRINPDLEIEIDLRDLRTHLDEESALAGPDLIVDTTASAVVRLKTENRLRSCGPRAPLASLAVSYNAQAGLATLALPTHSGGPADLARRLKLEACRHPTLSPLLDVFWPEAPRQERFQPEPGCSEPTFVGSDADLAALSARMVNAVAAHLADEGRDHPAAGWLLESDGVLRSFQWSGDTVIGGRQDRYEVRVSNEAMREIRGWARRSERLYGSTVETGGLLFGQLDEAAGVVWVTDAEGPPPDSDASSDRFTCGVEGMVELAHEKRHLSRGAVTCIGSWHTHPPGSPARPSNVDLLGAARVLADIDASRRTFLLLIVALGLPRPMVGAYVFRTGIRTQELMVAESVTQGEAYLTSASEGPRDLGLALSGGGSRAIAFHLGCFRALRDLELLDRIQVLSCVSGGSVIGALYAYHDGPFEEFDKRVVSILRRGLALDLAAALAHPATWVGNLVATGRFAIASLAQSALRLLGSWLWRSSRDNEPASRSWSRTEAFKKVLERYVGSRPVSDVQRTGLEVVFNATEMRTGSAFRFGSRESGCWRFGTISRDEALAADAVAASAAYPALLPALDRTYVFRNGDSLIQERVILSDGGLYDNLGVTCMEPGRSESFSTNVFEPDYILCCDAGTGLFEPTTFPYLVAFSHAAGVLNDLPKGSGRNS